MSKIFLQKVLSRKFFFIWGQIIILSQKFTIYIILNMNKNISMNMFLVKVD